jgi:hypothetical protein
MAGAAQRPRIGRFGSVVRRCQGAVRDRQSDTGVPPSVLRDRRGHRGAPLSCVRTTRGPPPARRPERSPPRDDPGVGLLALLKPFQLRGTDCCIQRVDTARCIEFGPATRLTPRPPGTSVSQSTACTSESTAERPPLLLSSSWSENQMSTQPESAACVANGVRKYIWESPVRSPMFATDGVGARSARLVGVAEIVGTEGFTPRRGGDGGSTDSAIRAKYVNDAIRALVTGRVA